MRRILLAAALLATPALAAPDATPVIEADRAFAAMSKEKGVKAAFAAYLSDDAVSLSGGRIVEGKAPFMAGLERAPAGFAMEWTPKGGEVSKDGTLGTTWGEFTRSMPGKDGAIVKVNGTYFNAWRKQPDGRWVVIADGGSDQPQPRKP